MAICELANKLIYEGTTFELAIFKLASELSYEETIYEETTCAGSVGRATFETFNQVYETLQSRAAEEQLNLKDMCCDGLCATQAQEECVLNEGQGDEPCVWDFGASDAGSGASQGQRLMALREQLAAMSREELLELRKEHEELVEQMGERD